MKATVEQGIIDLERLAQEAFDEAERRIAAHKQKRADVREIDLSDLRHLKKIPPSINRMKRIPELDLSNTSIDDISELSGISIGTLSISNTRVSDIFPISNIPKLKFLYAYGTNLNSKLPIEFAKDLQAVFLNINEEEDAKYIARWKFLSDKYCEGYECLFYLQESTSVPKGITNSLGDTNTVLFVNHFRAKLGMSPYWPAHYDGPREAPLSERSNEDDDLKSSDIQPVPGPNIFQFKNGKFEARPVKSKTNDQSLSQSLLEAIIDDANSILTEVNENYLDKALSNAIERTIRDISGDISDVPIGRLQVSLRRIQALSISYSQEDREADKTLRALLFSLSESMQDLVSTIPNIMEMESARMALGAISTEAIPIISNSIDHISKSAENSDIVGNSVIRALKDGNFEINALTETINDIRTSLPTRTIAIKKRGEIVGLQLLSIWNFGASIYSRISAEFKDAGIEAWRGAKEGIYEGSKDGTKIAVSGAIRIGLLALAVQIAGPFAPLAFVVPAFEVISKKLKSSTEKLEE